MYSDDKTREIVSSWNIEYAKTHPELDIAGSPERTAFRVVIEDGEHRVWVLESIFPDSEEHKLLIAKTLAHLHREGIRPVHPYLSNSENAWIVGFENEHWQIRPYVEGTPLPRPSYVVDRWRGKACAAFLLDLREKARDIPFFDQERPFSMARFIDEMSDTMESYNPETRKGLEQAFNFIEEEFVGVHDAFPVAFCHGDFHPLNVIWSEDNIRSVIDWEFLGIKPEVYDIATLIGCVGFEDPAGLTEGLVTELISQMRKADVLSNLSWAYLAEWVVAIRFAWLSDWLRRRDREMVDLEVAYINLLVDRCQALKAAWWQTG
jgi:homoserine kinase type II